MLYAELQTGQPGMGSILCMILEEAPHSVLPCTPVYPMCVDVLHVCQHVEKVGELECQVVEKDRETGDRVVQNHHWFTFDPSLFLMGCRLGLQYSNGYFVSYNYVNAKSKLGGGGDRNLFFCSRLF